MNINKISVVKLYLSTFDGFFLKSLITSPIIFLNGGNTKSTYCERTGEIVFLIAISVLFVIALPPDKFKVGRGLVEIIKGGSKNIISGFLWKVI